MSKQIRQWLLIILLIPTMATANQPDYFQAGVKAFQEGKYEEAVSYFQQASEEGEDKPQLNYNLGAAYFKTGQYERSEKEFKKLTYLPGWQALALSGVSEMNPSKLPKPNNDGRFRRPRP